jgi:di/tricarboxylate transporter
VNIHLLAILLLAAVFVIGTTRGLNLGALALVAGLVIVMVAAGGDVDVLYGAFPADLFVLLVGVTYLFGIATVNGTLAWVVDGLGAAVQRRAAVIPWLLFLITAAAGSIGGFVPAVVALLAPMGAAAAKTYDISPRLIGLMILHGANCGNFSPLNLLGATTHQILQRQGLEVSPLALFGANVGYNVVVGVVVYLVFGGRELLRRDAAERSGARARTDARATVGARVGAGQAAAGQAGVGEAAPAMGGAVAGSEVTASPQARADGSSGAPAPAREDDQPQDAAGGSGEFRLSGEGFTWQRGFTLLVIIVVATIALGFDNDFGPLALAGALLVRALTATSSKGAESKIAWNAVLLIGGVVTYVGVMQEIGTIDYVGHLANSISSPLLTAFVLCAIAAVVSAFASSAAMIAALIPLAVPFLASGDISVTGMVIALSIAATLVDVCPFSTVGALVISSADVDDRDYMYKTLLVWGAIAVLVTPFTTMLFVLPGRL